MKQSFVRSSYALASLVGVIGLFSYKNLPEPPVKKPTAADAIKLPAGFSATILGSELGSTRHITVSKNGDVYAKLSKLKDGKGILLMRDTNKDGVIDETKYFGNYPGTGITIKNGYLYASSNTGVLRYKLNANEEIIDPENPEKIVDGLVDKGRDNAKPFVLDNANNIYVTVGSYNDPCREKGSGKGIMPCSILDSAGGIWKFNAEKMNQTFSDGIRYATGLKNAVGTAWNSKLTRFLQPYTVVDSSMIFIRNIIRLSKVPSYPPKHFTNFTREMMLAGRMFTMTNFRRKKSLLPNMAETAKKRVAKKPLIRLWHFQHT